jgi:hypothetical protein
LKTTGRVRDLALFNCAINAKLLECDLVKLRICDVAPGGSWRARATIIQQKTGQPLRFEITEPARDSLATWLQRRGRRTDDWLFPSRSRPGVHITTMGTWWTQPRPLSSPGSSLSPSSNAATPPGVPHFRQKLMAEQWLAEKHLPYLSLRARSSSAGRAMSWGRRFRRVSSPTLSQAWP